MYLLHHQIAPGQQALKPTGEGAPAVSYTHCQLERLGIQTGGNARLMILADRDQSLPKDKIAEFGP